MLGFVEEIWRRGFRFDARSEEAPERGGASLSQGTHLRRDRRPAIFRPGKPSGMPADDLYNAMRTTATCQAPLADRKAALESLVRTHLKIDGFPVFSRNEETAFIADLRGCCSDRALLDLADDFACKCRSLNSALLQSVRVNANLV